MRLTYTQSAFNAGLLAPKVSKRIKTDQYYRGCRVMKNFEVTPQGPAERRRGTRFVAETKDSTVASRLIPFIFSDIDSYAMEFGNNYIRFFRGFSVVTNGDVGAGGTPTDPYEIATVYETADLANIKYVQEGDVMYLVAGGTDERPQKLTRQSTGQFTIADFDNQNGPVLDVIAQGTTLTASATTGSITVTASAATFESGHVGSLWELRDNTGVASSRGYFRITGFTSSTVVSATVQSDLFGTTASQYWGEGAWSGVRGYPNSIAFHEQRLAFGATNSNPLTVYFSKSNANYEDFDYADAGEADGFTVTLSGQKNTIRWLVSDTNFLVAGTYGGLAFVGSGNSTAALSVTNVQTRNGESFGSNVVQGVLFGTGIKYLQSAGTRLYQTQYDDLSLKYTVSDLTSLSDEILSGGGTYSAPQTEPYETLWVTQTNGSLVGFTEENEQQVQAFHEHTTAGTFESVVIVPNAGQDQQWFIVNRTIGGATKRYVEYKEPDRTLEFFVDSGVEYDGQQAATLTLSSADVGTGVTATAGSASFVSGDVGRKIFTFDSNGAFVGRATITGFTSATVVTVTITAAFASTSIAANGWFLSATNITGLTHLEGETVQVLSDGIFVGEETVSSGEIDIEDEEAGGVIYVGLKFASDIKIQPIETGSKVGTTVTKPKRINRVGFSVYQSNAFKTGRDFDNLLTIPSRKPSQAMNQAVPQFGGDEIEDFVRSVNSRWDKNATIVVRQDFPVGLTLAAMTMYMEVSETF